ncbi:alpha/beta hydrolase [Candidatus Amarolinea dominans]|uniref:alpha/beta fold hydrolase n=1 Tax=Candidatus Amarolinea dominans TaxID=3140696 RepID=UPI0031CC9D46
MIAALLVACAGPAAAPTATPVPLTAAPTPVPPTATLEPTVSVVPTATVQAPPATPAAPGLEKQPSDVLSGFVENNGVRIHYEVEGEGPPLVLVHWLTGSLQDWRVVGYADALKANYRLILIDARGHGQSDKPHDPAAYVLEKQAGDIVAVLDKLGVDKAHYFGYSLGGTVGWAVAKYFPDRLSSLIIGGEAPENFDPSADIRAIAGSLLHNTGAWQPMFLVAMVSLGPKSMPFMLPLILRPLSQTCKPLAPQISRLIYRA